MRLQSSGIQDAVDAPTDIFRRDDFAGGLLNLFERSETPLVVALDERWGTGKTVFARRLERRARRENFKVIYFDAFKRDYDDDVFVALAAEIIAEAGNSKEAATLKEKAKSVAKVMGRVALKGAVRAVTAGVVRVSDFSEANEEVASEIGNEVEAELDKLIDSRLSNSRTERSAFESFRTSLAKIAGDGDDKPLLFIVDELDRCRPDYSLAVLETIKHFFSVEGVHFFLLAQFDQLSASVESRYGSNISGELYLEKFVDVRVSFPALGRNDRARALASFVSGILRVGPNDGQNGKLREAMGEFLTDLAILKDYSLRRIERIITHFHLAMAYSNPQQERIGPILFLLCDLKQTNRLLFHKAKTGKIEAEELIDHFSLPQDRYDWYIDCINFCLLSGIDVNSDQWRSYKSLLFNFGFRGRQEIIPHFANEVVDRISPID